MVQEDKLKIVFQDGSCGSHLRSLISKILYKSFCCCNVSFNSNQTIVQEEMSKIDFQDGGCGGHFGFSIFSLREERATLGIFRKCLICACLVLSVSSSSWCLGRAAVCDCATPWTFLLPFFFSIMNMILATFTSTGWPVAPS